MQMYCISIPSYNYNMGALLLQFEANFLTMVLNHNIVSQAFRKKISSYIILHRNTSHRCMLQPHLNDLQSLAICLDEIY